MKAEAALEVAGRALLLRMAAKQRRVDIDRHLWRRAGELPNLLARLRMGALKRLEHPRRRRDLVDHPIRRGVRRSPEQIGLITHRAQIGQAIAAVGEHHREVTDHAPGIVAGVALAQPRKLV